MLQPGNGMQPTTTTTMEATEDERTETELTTGRPGDHDHFQLTWPSRATPREFLSALIGVQRENNTLLCSYFNSNKENVTNIGLNGLV